MGVSPNSKNPSAEVLLSDQYGNRWELRVEGGVDGIREASVTPSTLRINQQGSKWGGWDPDTAKIEQSQWSGGRGSDDYSEYPDRSWDQTAWTLSSGKILPALQWRWGTGFRSADMQQVGKRVKWVDLYSSFRYLEVSFAASASYSADKAYIPIRKIGAPGTLTVELCADSSGNCSTVLKTATITADDIPDLIIYWQKFDWITTQALTAATTYHLKIYGASTDADYAHWQVMVAQDFTGVPSQYSTAGSTWASMNGRMIFRVTDADVNKKYHFAVLEGGLYAVNELAAGGKSTVYRMGDRGSCDSNSGALTTLVDATRTWTVNGWAGWRARIVASPGIGETRLIVSNTTTALTVNAAFDTTQTTSSEYVIERGGAWSALTLSPDLAAAVTDTCVSQGQIMFAQGGSNAVLKLSHTLATSVHATAADGSNYADLLHAFSDTEGTPVVWKALYTGSEIKVADAVAVGSAHTFGPAITVGETSKRINALFDYDGKLVIGKEDSLWLSKGDKPQKFNAGLEAATSLTNFLAMCVRNLYLYFGWGSSLERLYGTTLDDTGLSKAFRMPDNRRGKAVCAVPIGGAIFIAYDAGDDGYSSILAYDDRGYHEVWRAWEIGKRLSNLIVQTIPDDNDRLWFACGGDILYLNIPREATDPTTDKGCYYSPESILVSSTYDMGMKQLPKFFKKLEVLADDIHKIYVDYQVDDDIGTDYWREFGVLRSSPIDFDLIERGNVRGIRIRLRIMLEDLQTPTVVRATVLHGFARTPTARQWQISYKMGGIKHNGRAITVKELKRMYDWIWATCQDAEGLRMRCVVKEIDDIPVIIEPPGLIRTYKNVISGLWGGIMTLTIREMT